MFRCTERRRASQEQARDQRRHRLPDDQGFTLIELMAAIVVTTIAFAGLASALIAGLAGTSASAASTAATQLASERIETLRTIPWNQLGHYADEPEWGSGFYDSESMVKVADTTPSPRPTAVPELSETTANVRGVDYAVTTRVTWAGSSTSVPNTGDTYAQKRMSVTVEWTLRGKTRSITQDALRAPNGTEMKPPAASASTPISFTLTEASPSQTLDSDGGLTEEVLLRADTSVVGQSVSVAYQLSTGNAASVELTPDATYRFWSGTLPVGTGPLAAGSLTLTFTATHSSGSTTTAEATLALSPAVAEFALTDATATTTTSQLVTGSLLAAPLDVSVRASVGASSVTATYPLSDGTTSAPLDLAYSGAGGVWTGQIPAGAGPLTPGNLTITFGGTSTSGVTATTTASVTLQAPTLGAIAINPPTVSPSFCSRKSSPYTLKRASAVTVEVMNVDALNTAVSVTLGASSPLNAAALGTTGPSGGQLFRVTYGTSTVLDATSVSIAVSVTRQADGATASGLWIAPVKQTNGSC